MRGSVRSLCAACKCAYVLAFVCRVCRCRCGTAGRGCTGRDAGVARPMCNSSDCRGHRRRTRPRRHMAATVTLAPHICAGTLLPTSSPGPPTSAAQVDGALSPRRDRNAPPPPPRRRVHVSAQQRCRDRTYATHAVADAHSEKCDCRVSAPVDLWRTPPRYLLAGGARVSSWACEGLMLAIVLFGALMHKPQNVPLMCLVRPCRDVMWRLLS